MRGDRERQRGPHPPSGQQPEGVDVKLPEHLKAHAPRRLFHDSARQFCAARCFLRSASSKGAEKQVGINQDRRGDGPPRGSNSGPCCEERVFARAPVAWPSGRRPGRSYPLSAVHREAAKRWYPGGRLQFEPTAPHLLRGARLHCASDQNWIQEQCNDGFRV
jgi:hypothetical protein